MTKIIIDMCIGKGDGHAPSEGNDDYRSKADQSDKDKQHQKYSHSSNKVILVQYTELGHIEPVVSELCAVPIFSLNNREAIVSYILAIKVIGFACFIFGSISHCILSFWICSRVNIPESPYSVISVTWKSAK